MSQRYSTRGVLLEGNIAFLRDIGATVKFMHEPMAGGPVEVRAEGAPTDAATKGDSHTSAVVKVTAWGAERYIQYALWGTNNLRGQDLFKEASKSGILKAALRVRRAVHYGAGPMYYEFGANQTDETITPVPIQKLAPEIQLFHRRVQLEKAAKQIILNHEWWGWWGTEHLLSNNYQKIVSYRPFKTLWTRWSLMNEETGRVEWCLMNPNWDLMSMNTTQLIPVADPWWTPEEVREWARENGYTKFVRPNLMPDPDAGYYPDQDWHALYDNQWLPNTNKIPLQRAAFLKFALSAQFHIKMPYSYFEKKYERTWGDMSEAERDQKRLETLEYMNTFLSGVENAGKAFVSEVYMDEDGKEITGWSIEPIKHNQGETMGSSIADSEKGNSEMLATAGVDPTLLGQGAPGGKLGAGSGSDKAEAVRIMHALMYADREATTEDWHFTRDYNGWPQDLYMGYRQIELTSLDRTKAEQPPPNPS